MKQKGNRLDSLTSRKIKDDELMGETGKCDPDSCTDREVVLGRWYNPVVIWLYCPYGDLLEARGG